MLQLDLHGVHHYAVRDSVENWVLENQWDCPLLIITGNSVEMQRLVNLSLATLGVEHTSLRQGTITVLRVV